jgi:curli biogenesis system outer membrane secretion channel CsgG
MAVGALTACMVLWAANASAAQLRKTIGVSNFENRTNYAGQITLESGMADQLTDSLMRSGNFVVVERQTLGDVLSEQDLAASGRAARSETAQTGKLVPAQVLIKGTVTEFDVKKSGGGARVGYGGFSLGGSTSTAHVAVILRLIDTTSGEVLDSLRVEGKASAGAADFAGAVSGVSFGTEGFARTPLGKALQQTIDNAVVQIVNRLQQVPFTGKIIKVEGDTVYTNIGSRNGVAVGETFDVYAVEQELVDPDTGESLGSEKARVGSIAITSVEEKYSKASSQAGGFFEAGYIVTK